MRNYAAIRALVPHFGLLVIETPSAHEHAHSEDRMYDSPSADLVARKAHSFGAKALRSLRMGTGDTDRDANEPAPPPGSGPTSTRAPPPPALDLDRPPASASAAASTLTDLQLAELRER